MVYEFKLPDIGEGVHEAEIIQWHVNEGDNVKEDQVLLEIHTEKINTEITSPVAGTILSLEKSDGDIVEVGQVLVKIDAREITPSEEKEEKIEATATTAVEEKDDSLFKPDMPFKHIRHEKEKVEEKEMTKRVLAAPAVRRRAREAGVDLHNVEGSAPGGRITQQDLEEYLATKSTVKAVPPTKAVVSKKEEERIPLRGTRRIIAQNMRKAKDIAAHYTYFDEVDMTALDELRYKARPTAEKKGIKLTYLPLVIKCLIPTLKQFPILNSTLDDENEEIIIKNYYNIGIAVDTAEGLVVPVIKNADRKNVWELATEITDLAKRAREGNLTLEDIKGGTFTITSVGNIGGMMATPIIRWPEVAILGLMRAKMRPVAIKTDGTYEVKVKKIMYLSITLDHRVVDGAVGARFGNALIQYMENPSLLILAE